jgi:hypothetical protein
MGANTIRTYNLMNSASTRAEVLQALDSAHANNLKVVMGYFVQVSENFADASTRTRLRSEFLASVQAYKDHPAVLLWAIGNEQNLNNGNSNANWYSLVNQMAGDAKAADPNHPVTSVQGEIPGTTTLQIGSAGFGTDDATMTNLDLWGVNAYRGQTFGNLFSTLASSTSKPILLTEFGKDAYRDAAGAEDQAMQAGYLSAQWTQIAANLSATGSGILAGGVIFEWSDEWWKDFSGLSCQTHDSAILFSRSDDTTDPGYNEEWFGMVSVSPVDAVSNPAGTQRTLRRGYTTMQGFWNPQAVQSLAASSSVFEGTVRNFPNPFRVGSQNTTFVALVTGAATIDVAIYDAGQQFVTSISRSTTGQGRLEVSWDGRNSQGAHVSPGLYFARIEGRSNGREDKQFRRVVAVK